MSGEGDWEERDTGLIKDIEDLNHMANQRETKVKRRPDFGSLLLLPVYS